MACGYDKKPLFKPFFFVVGNSAKGADVLVSADDDCRGGECGG
jgi:hypothetical protein